MPEKLLVTGPPASGKSRVALDLFLSSAGGWLIVPTATMAEHLRNEMARARRRVRPSQVMTLAQLLEMHSAAAAQAPAMLTHLLVREALHKLSPPRFKAVARYAGFERAVAALVDESTAGDLPRDLAAIAEFVERALRERGFATRPARLRCEVRATPAAVVFDGFFSLSQAERELIVSLARRAPVTVTLPEADPGLVRAGFAKQRLAGRYRNAQTACFCAPSMERETEEIARRVLDEVGRGRQFREMGVIVRVREPYASALQTTFARFGIPARFYFSDALERAPAIRCLAGIVRAMIDGWDHAALVSALRMPVSGIGATPEGDRFDFEVREQLPASGLPLPQAGEFLARFDFWRHDRVPGIEWGRRFRELASLLSPTAGPRHDRRGFIAVLDQVAALDAERLNLKEFWDRVALALSIEQLRVPDRRRNVVHVMDVFEARQWELPVVFVCGLVERQFPQYHSQDSLLDDAARRRAGLRTSADLDREERFLFELARTRATEQTVLSYARFDEKGEETIRSFFLENTEAIPCDERVRPAPARTVAPAPRSAIREAELVQKLGEMHGTLSPTSVENFLQCPFQFFAQKTLRLRTRPAAPRDRLDVRLQGIILHRALAEASRMPLLAHAIFLDVFADECRRARVPEGYRTEAVRLELARHFAGFLEDRRVATGWQTRVEEQFLFPLNPLVSIRGRMDRLDVSPHKEALVIDYKYSAGQKIRERVDECAAGNLVQGGLYLIAVERCFALDPAGMLYCGLRKEVVWDGWHAAVPGLDGIGETSTRARLRELMDASAAKAMEAFEAITGGVIAPRPADTDKCRWCDYRDICRVETAAATREAGTP